jgi:hypothetical protein
MMLTEIVCLPALRLLLFLQDLLKKGAAGNTKPHGWTAELDIALLEEV